MCDEIMVEIYGLFAPYQLETLGQVDRYFELTHSEGQKALEICPIAKYLIFSLFK